MVLGKQDQVNAVPGEEAQMLIDKAQKDQVTTDIALDPSVTAPVSRGQRLGTLTLKAGEQILRQVPLVAAEGVQRLSFGEIFLQVLRRLAMAK